jgi:glycosyltransferase involved in cell wall biosynthesis
MAASPLVTFYVPVFNGARFLRECLDSIVAQTLGDWECIVIDDHSTDESPAIIASYRDPRFVAVRQLTNLNVANAANLALRLARGKYLARLDQDDIALPRRLEQQVAMLEADAGLAVCGGGLDVFGESSGLWLGELSDGAIKADLLPATGGIANPASTVRIDFLRNRSIVNDPRFPLSCDYGMWVDCALAGGRFANVPEPVTRYRTHPGQGSRDMEKLVVGVVDAKTRLLLHWFPDLAFSEVQALEPLLRINGMVFLPKEAAAAGLAACRKAMDPGRASVNGEDRQRVRAFLAARAAHWQKHFDE